MKVGILEFGTNYGLSGPDILKNVIEYAQRADACGFSRFWLTEHHSENLGWNNPEMLLPTLASCTERIKIGLAGTLAAVHSPYRVACSFKLLSTLYTGRIDLGFANGRPSLQTVRYLLNRKKVTNDIYSKFSDNVRLVCDFFKGETATSISPFSTDFPQMWLLGSSNYQLPLARELGLGFSKSLFHTNAPISENLDLLFTHKELFAAEHHMSAPLNLAFSGLCDMNSQRAEKRFFEMYKFKYDPCGNSIVGSPAYFSDRLGALQEATGIDEFIFKDLDLDNCHRLKTLSALSSMIKDHSSKTKFAL